MDKDWDAVIKEKIEEQKKRGAKKRGWVVLRKSWLTSSINYRCNLDEIAVFSKLIVMADEFGPVPGLISDNDLRPMPHEYLAHQACCPLEIFESMLKKGVQDDSIYENSHGIFLTHFDDYQFTEYDRQKPYREEAKVSFEEYVETMRAEYPGLDIDKELKKFETYWSEGDRTLKRPKSAFHNWLDKAMEIKKSREPKSQSRRDPDRFVKGEYGRMVQR